MFMCMTFRGKGHRLVWYIMHTIHVLEQSAGAGGGGTLRGIHGDLDLIFETFLGINQGDQEGIFSVKKGGEKSHVSFSLIHKIENRGVSDGMWAYYRTVRLLGRIG
jgi:hypothetical protein